MGELDPDNADEWDTVEEYEHAGRTIEIRSGGYLHLAGFVDGELVVQDHDSPTHVKKQTELEASYRSVHRAE